MQVLVILGLKHSGKSSLGKSLAEHLGYQWADLDESILDLNPNWTDIRSLYRSKGRDWFRTAECQAYEHIQESQRSGMQDGDNLPVAGLIISTGGGSMENGDLMQRIQASEARILFIDAPQDLLYQRIIRGGIPPFLEGDDPEQAFTELYQRRRAQALCYADMVLDAGAQDRLSLLHTALNLIM